MDFDCQRSSKLCVGNDPLAGTSHPFQVRGYLEGEGDEQAEGIAIEAYLGDSL
jgi:hypothetical protein